MLFRTQLNSFLAIERSETLEIPITDPTVYKYNFPILRNLENKLITGFESNIYYLPFQASPLNRRIVGIGTSSRSYVTLKSKQGKILQDRIAVGSLLLTTGNVKKIDYSSIDWENSFVEIADDPAASVAAPAGQSFLFTIYYENKPNYGALISRLLKYRELATRMAR